MNLTQTVKSPSNTLAFNTHKDMIENLKNYVLQYIQMCSVNFAEVKYTIKYRLLYRYLNVRFVYVVRATSMTIRQKCGGR